MQSAPGIDCTNACVDDFRAIDFEDERYTEEEVFQDDLFVDVEQAVLNCRSENLDENEELDNVKFFGCSVEMLKSLKGTYEYLN